MPAESDLVGGGTRKGSAVMDGIRKMVCDKCGRGWDALCYESSERLECPGCGYMVQVPPQEAVESAGTDTQQANAENTACNAVESLCELCGGRIVQCADEQRCERCGELFRLL